MAEQASIASDLPPEVLARIAELEIQAQTTVNTTLLELLKKYHDMFGDGPNIPMDKGKCTTGTTSNVTDKVRPRSIQPWEDFLDLRQAKFGEVKAFLGSQRLFKTPNQIDGVAKDLKQTVVSSEIDLRLYHNSAVESPVKDIIRELISNPAARTQLCLGDSMTLNNHANVLNNPGAKAVDIPKDADQICVKHVGDKTTTAVIIEFKAPHKATIELLTAGLRPMDLKHDVIDKIGTTVEKGPVQFQRAADKFVAMIITQTYHYMVRAGVRYGCVLTGQATVLLFIDKDEPEKVSFYHADPKAEVQDELDRCGEFSYECTAIALLTGFCLIAHSDSVSSQAWRQAVLDRDLRWNFDDHDLDRIPSETKDLDKPASAYKPRREITESYRTPIKTRSAASQCKPGDNRGDRNRDNDDPDDREDHDNTPTKPTSRTYRQSAGRQEKKPAGQETKNTSRGTAKDYSYCTQKCLKGLTERTAMHRSCPNYHLHPSSKNGTTHALTRPLLARLLRQQLAADLDDYCIDLQKQGRTGRLFKLTLASHGYTFVGKGTVKYYVPKSKHEARVYKCLKERQGQSIPVHLGNIDLLRPWIECNFDIVHMLLMSYAGECIDENIARGEGDRGGRKEARDFDRECLQIGVLHTDTYVRNMMWSDESQQIMFVDFDCTILFDLGRPPKRVLYSVLYQEEFGHWRLRKTQKAQLKQTLNTERMQLQPIEEKETTQLEQVEEAEADHGVVLHPAERPSADTLTHEQLPEVGVGKDNTILDTGRFPEPEELKLIPTRLPKTLQKTAASSRTKLDWAIHTDADTEPKSPQGKLPMVPSASTSQSATYDAVSKAGSPIKAPQAEQDKENAPFVDSGSGAAT
ncbi:MAG: hypothetical protein LQ346_003619 [Caloplaca aetnensis]|nr:MAG: hypothetical protein LQ346_003619 [Caloplaca aetnensis]